MYLLLFGSQPIWIEGTHVVANWTTCKKGIVSPSAIPGLEVRFQSPRKQRGHEEAKEERNSGHGFHYELLLCYSCSWGPDILVGTVLRVLGWRRRWWWEWRVVDKEKRADIYTNFARIAWYMCIPRIDVYTAYRCIYTIYMHLLVEKSTQYSWQGSGCGRMQAEPIRRNLLSRSSLS